MTAQYRFTLLPVTYTLYVYETDLFIDIGIQGPHICIITVGSHQNIISRHINNHRTVVISVLISQLYNIARLHALFVGFHPIGTCGFISCEKIIKIHDPGPAGTSVGSAAVIPSHGRRVVHDPASGINTLGCKIGAVPAHMFKIQIPRIPPLSPSFRVFQDSFPLISNLLQYSMIPVLSQPLLLLYDHGYLIYIMPNLYHALLCE